MMYKRILAVGLTAVMAIGVSVSASVSAGASVFASIPSIVPVARDYHAESYSVVTISRTEPTMLTNEQLQTLAETAPDIYETRSALIMPGRRVTDDELAAWSDEYWELGGLNAFELEVIRLINIERAARHLQPLAVDPLLSMAARFHSTEMADFQFFGHASPNHGRGVYRAEMFGHENIQEHVWGVRENIAGSTRIPERVVQLWMDSPGHRAAILEAEFLTIGVGAVRGGGTTAKFGS